VSDFVSQLRALSAQATPGPWKKDGPQALIVPSLSGTLAPPALFFAIHGKNVGADRDLIQHLRNHADAIAEAVEALEYTREWLWNPDENANAQFERIGAMYHADTGYLRPGKDDPFSDASSTENRKRFQEWCAGQNRKRHERMKEALARLNGEAP
jgi:hypothetical protein